MLKFVLKGVVVILASILSMSCTLSQEHGKIMTVNGIITSDAAGSFLTHEHVLVDFIGADSINFNRWNKEEVIRKMLPFLMEAKESGCRTFVDCTPDYLGRDAVLLSELSKLSGVNILTNTGLYGAGGDKYIPEFAFDETAEQLAERWTTEWENGINGTGVKPGFIKIGVDGGHLSDMHLKLVKAAAKTHLRTGLVISSHTGPSIPAFEQLAVLEKEGVSPEAFIWVHAQAEKNSQKRIEAAQKGAWISLDGLSDDNITDYIEMINELKNENLLQNVLLSHDAGWYDPAKPEGGNPRGFTALFRKLVPALVDNGFNEDEIRLLLEINPAKAFEIKIRK